MSASFIGMTNKELPDEAETLVMPAEAARMLHVTTKTLQRMAIRGDIRAVTLPSSNHRRYRLADIKALLKDTTEAVAS